MFRITYSEAFVQPPDVDYDDLRVAIGTVIGILSFLKHSFKIL